MCLIWHQCTDLCIHENEVTIISLEAHYMTWEGIQRSHYHTLKVLDRLFYFQIIAFAWSALHLWTVCTDCSFVSNKVNLTIWRICLIKITLIKSGIFSRGEMYARFVVGFCFPWLVWTCSLQGLGQPRPVLPSTNRYALVFNWRGVAALQAQRWDPSCSHWECINISIAVSQLVHNDNLKLCPLGAPLVRTHT